MLLSLKTAIIAGLIPFLLASASQDIDADDGVVEDSDTFYPDLHPCPRSCEDKPRDQWDLFSSLDRLAICAEPMLVDIGLYSSLDDADAPMILHACTQGDANTKVNALFHTGAQPSNSSKQAKHRAKRRTNKCAHGTPEPVQLQIDASRHSSSDGSNTSAIASMVHDAVDFFRSDKTCSDQSIFAYLNGTVIGLYAGTAISRDSVRQIVNAVLNSTGIPDEHSDITAQLCREQRNARYSVGLAVRQKGDLASLRKILSLWDRGKCLPMSEQRTNIPLTIREMHFQSNNSTHRANATSSHNGTASWSRTRAAARLRAKSLTTRGECRAVRVHSGDSCGSLADQCGISGADFTKYNSDASLCASLIEGQHVCCSSGDLPDFRPKADGDGNCAIQYVDSGDNCASIAANYSLTIDDLEKFNTGKTGTWGWTGCSNLLAHMNICVSEGYPPMPAVIPNAVCGPTKATDGDRPTHAPAGTALADLNPCPLNACCNIWGQCGISGDFCTDQRGPTGNPGTGPKGVFSCISNCGLDIKQTPRSGSFGHIGYYESWNMDRPCLNMQAENANIDGTYNTIHWAFMDIDPATWAPKLKDDHNQWDGFVSLYSVRKVISFGGWGFSTEPSTYDLLRQAMSPNHRSAFAKNIWKFVTDNGLDGVDIDWEYPGATDIEGTPAGKPDDGRNYLRFLMELKAQRPSADKTISIAAPASYWYLKAFPIKQMAAYLDYIVYMTYDLHGQWDAGNQYSMEGCPAGNCLRSHINRTETTTVLSMITKAGVPSNKIYVGEASYGRSFKMSSAGCDGPDCTFLGDRHDSHAAPGYCTNTAGYISRAEIQQIKDTYGGNKAWHDAASDSDILVYSDTEWVAYMEPFTKKFRAHTWENKDFAGTVDWAVDLWTFNPDDDGGVDHGSRNGPSLHPGPCNGTYATLDAIEKDMAKMTPYCRQFHTLEVLETILNSTLATHDSLMAHNYDHNFGQYADAVVSNAPDAVKNFMYGHGNEYFTCEVTEPIDGCEHCHDGLLGAKDKQRGCRYCEDYECQYKTILCSSRPPCPPDHNKHFYKFHIMSMPCPPDYSLRSALPDKSNNTRLSTKWTMQPGVEDKFYAHLFSETAIPQEKITWHDRRFPMFERYYNDVKDPVYWHYNFPDPDKYSASDISNPKEVFERARKNLTAIGPDLHKLLDQARKQTFLGAVDEVVDALSLPILMAEASVNSMKQLNDLGHEIEEQRNKKTILFWISSILFFLPIIGEVAGSIAVLANIARLLAFTTDISTAAFDIYTVVDTHGNDPLAIFGLIFAPLAIFDAGRIAVAARIKRGMPDEQVAKLGPDVKGKMDQIDRISGRRPGSGNKDGEHPGDPDGEGGSIGFCGGIKRRSIQKEIDWNDLVRGGLEFNPVMGNVY